MLDFIFGIKAFTRGMVIRCENQKLTLCGLYYLIINAQRRNQANPLSKWTCSFSSVWGCYKYKRIVRTKNVTTLYKLCSWTLLHLFTPEPREEILLRGVGKNAMKVLLTKIGILHKAHSECFSFVIEKKHFENRSVDSDNCGMMFLRRDTSVIRFCSFNCCKQNTSPTLNSMVEKSALFDSKHLCNITSCFFLSESHLSLTNMDL